MESKPKSFTEQLYPYLAILEVVFLMAFTGGLLLLFLQVAASRQLLLISLSGLATIYFLNAFKPMASSGNNFSAFLVGILNKVFGISTSVGVIGILFFLLRFTGYQQMVLMSASTIIIGLLIALLLSFRQAEVIKALKDSSLRAVPVAAVCLWVLMKFGMHAG